MRLVFDDSGSGYASLAHLRDLPVDRVKSDRSFVQDLRHPRGASIVGPSIELAHNLGLTVVAEGVQDKDTFDRLRELGCDTAQGDYLSEPLDGPAVLPWLRARESQQVVQP